MKIRSVGAQFSIRTDMTKLSSIFRRVRKIAKSDFSIIVALPLSAWKTRLQLDGFSLNFVHEYFSKMSTRLSRLVALPHIPYDLQYKCLRHNTYIHPSQKVLFKTFFFSGRCLACHALETVTETRMCLHIERGFPLRFPQEIIRGPA